MYHIKINCTNLNLNMLEASNYCVFEWIKPKHALVFMMLGYILPCM